MVERKGREGGVALYRKVVKGKGREESMVSLTDENVGIT